MNRIVCLPPGFGRERYATEREARMLARNLEDRAVEYADDPRRAASFRRDADRILRAIASGTEEPRL